MKKIILFLFFTFNCWALAQNTPRYDYKPAVQSIPQEILQKLGFPDYKANIAETEPTFQGGLYIFRAAISDKFDTSAVESGSGRLSTILFFIIEKDGTISEVTTSGANGDFNKEAERTVKSIKNIWVPAKAGNKPIRYVYELPLVMNFD
ncbi:MULTISPECIES: energy transducer TonB [Chryseobacterium]|uniref:TonB-like protein n=1 Tax=Chryseobacterium geocarposphaerae TaxID=1416776 RepID=A0ABU1LE17_9FLAO|nr:MULTISPECIES: hypothetical protein [Chryseobacterium]MDR6404954.1 hypothetical protein [Chryseobacterium geocarposphaerae]MDR6697737.1 hypothetical protein [Chryseobacterium ginsenosidimutans]